ncbi:ROOT CAP POLYGALACTURONASE [Hibiscus trionum]|uniref:ROOT CAP POLYGALACTURONASE n=1 Tax=Hibiscus trionum TaxID=183268 RepID=A0A9W7M4J8_HIBTR|nr:ROOT CAP POLYGALACTURONASE [Hibiscus trionum]
MKLSDCNLHGIMVVVFVMLSINSTSAVTKFNVLNFGAKPNGRTDSIDGFLKAWNTTCGSADSSFIYVPKGQYLVGSLEFKGKCRSSEIIIRIDGTIVAPLDYGVLGNWFSFEGVTGFSITGAGAFDAKGPSLWACKVPTLTHVLLVPRYSFFLSFL